MKQTAEKLSPTAKKYLAIIESGMIEENQIIAMKSFINKSRENRDIILPAMADKPLLLTESQNNKEFDFLMKQWETPGGLERKNNPFGYREKAILENFSHFELKGWYNIGTYGEGDFYVPLYECVGNNTSFEYYYDGKVNIVD
jgi:hypothetical protein